MVLKYESTGELVKILQELLDIKADGIFGRGTNRAVQQFQKRNGLYPDGVVGPLTWNKLEFDPVEEDLDTDRECFENWIETYHLSEGQYIKEETSKKYIMIHHTAGRENPYNVIDHWNRDNRGRVGTNYVIGGTSTKGDDAYNGKVLRAIDDKYYGWHIGRGGSFYMKKHSLSIEICSAGGLKQREDGKWYTWFGEQVEDSQVYILKKPFRGYKAFQKYTKEQLKSLRALLIYLSEKHDINLKVGMHKIREDGGDMFEWNSDIYNGRLRGLISHTNVRRDKSDVFPQLELIEMIKQF